MGSFHLREPPSCLSHHSHAPTQHPQARVGDRGGGAVCDITDIYLLLGEATSCNKPRLQRAFSLMGGSSLEQKTPRAHWSDCVRSDNVSKDAQRVTEGSYISDQWTPGTVALAFNGKYGQKRREKQQNVIRYSWKWAAGRSKLVRHTTGGCGL